MKVSIIIPVYNVAEYVLSCLKSVVVQDWNGELECILVDDCGTDSSMEIVEQFVLDYSGAITFVILHHTHNRGLSAARNTGMAAATGEYIFFLDSDDEISADCLRMLTDPLSEQCYDMVVGDNDKFRDDCDTGRSIIQESAISFVKASVLTGEELISMFSTGRVSTAWNKLYNTDFLKSHHLSFEEDIIHEDELWSFQLSCLLQSVRVVKVCTYHYRKREGSIMDGYDVKFEKDVLPSFECIIDKVFQFVRENKIEGKTSINRYFQKMLVVRFCRIVIFFSPNAFEEFYSSIRRCHISKIMMLKADGFNIKDVVRDIHWLFPKDIGMKIVKFYLMV